MAEPGPTFDPVARLWMFWSPARSSWYYYDSGGHRLVYPGGYSEPSVHPASYYSTQIAEMQQGPGAVFAPAVSLSSSARQSLPTGYYPNPFADRSEAAKGRPAARGSQDRRILQPLQSRVQQRPASTSPSAPGARTWNDTRQSPRPSSSYSPPNNGQQASGSAPTRTNQQNKTKVTPARDVPHGGPTSLNGFRIAIICALKTEYNAVDALMEARWERVKAYRPRQGDNNTYRFGRFGGKAVALVLLPNMGMVSAAVAASTLTISLKNIEIAFLVGICAGNPYDENHKAVHMADVIIGTQVIQEDSGRLRDTGFERKQDVEDVLGRLPPRVKGWLVQRSCRRELEQLKAYTQRVLSNAFQNPSIARDFAFPGREAGEAFPTSREPQILFGRIGSANQVQRSQAERDRMIKQDRILGFEMESAGTWDRIPTVVVKAVCDYADSHKSKEWQAFAALTAAACAKALVREWISHVQDSASGKTVGKRPVDLAKQEESSDGSEDHESSNGSSD